MQNQGYELAHPQHPQNLPTVGACEGDKLIDPNQQDHHETGKQQDT